jgi:hypothetical protein
LVVVLFVIVCQVSLLSVEYSKNTLAFGTGWALVFNRVPVRVVLPPVFGTDNGFGAIRLRLVSVG